MKRNSGLTLMELIVTVFILSVGVLASIGSYQYITTSLQFSKGRTLATNLAQEQVEKLKNLSYYTLLVTTGTPYADSRLSPTIYYDLGNYPPQTILEGGLTFTRATRIDFAYQNGSVISTAAYTTDDTALKQISVFVMWQERGIWKSIQVQSLFANPAASPLNAAAAGNVTSTSGSNISGAYVQVIDNSNWYGATDASGNYRFSVSEGSYTLQASSQGYYTATTNGYKSFSSGNTTTTNFTLTAIGSGTVTGYVYSNDHVVIDQVVASTDTSIDYVQLYNPTTSAYNLGAVGNGWDASATNPWIAFYDETFSIKNGFIVRISTYIGPQKHYLIANTASPIHVGGRTLTPDATFPVAYTSPTHFVDKNIAAGVTIYFYNQNSFTWVVQDTIGWARGATNPPAGYYEGTPYPTASGFQDGYQLIRMNSPGVNNIATGNAYDTGNNNYNLSLQTTALAASDSSMATASPISGTPATGAVVRMNDLLGRSATCDATTISGIYPVCLFSLTASTGTWTMEISSNSSYSQIQNITVQTSVSTAVPNGVTSPTWAAVSTNSITLLNQTTTYAFVSGHVYSGSGSPISGIRISDGNGRTATTTSAGLFNLISTTGSITLTANPNDGTMNRSYSTQGRAAETFLDGNLYPNRDFSLELSGIIRGYYQTSSNTSLPSRVARAVKTIGTESTEAASDNTGFFYLQNLSTGTYTVTPILDTMESASPASYTVSLVSTGTTTSVSTFTVTSGVAQITGQVLVAASTTTIKTGALIVASTSTISGTLPPSQSGASGASCSPCYYSASSDASGNYTLYVRSSTTPYKVYGWYSTISGNSATTTKAGAYSVTISTPGQIMSQNISW